MLYDTSTIQIDTANAHPALQAVFDKAQPGDRIFLRPGVFRLARPLKLADRAGVEIVGTHATRLVKAWKPAYSARSVLQLERCDHARLRGFAIEGSTPDSFPLWNDDGLSVMEAVDVGIEDMVIHGCGDAGLRVCGSASNLEMAPGVVTTRDIRVQNCRISDVYQTSTTPNGVACFHFLNNVVRNLHGSVKFASRNVGAGDLFIHGNRIQGAEDNRQGGLEIYGYAGISILGNIITDCMGDAAVHLHTNAGALCPEPVRWRDAVIQANIFLRNKATVRVVDAGGQLVQEGNILPG